MLAFALALWGCSSTPAPTPAPPPAAPASSAAPAATAPPAPAAPFGGKGFVCCDSESAHALVDKYLGVQRALAKDDAAGATAAAALLASAAKAQADGAPEPDRARLEAIATASAAVTGKDLPAVREAFKPLSAAALPYARAHTGGATQVAEAYCPMADASWVQTEATISNPYYGSEMLTCGSFR